MILSSPYRKEMKGFLYQMWLNMIVIFYSRLLLCDVTSLAKLRSGEVWGGCATAGLGDSSTFSSITSAAVSFMSVSSGKVTEEVIVSTGGASTELDLKPQRVTIIHWTNEKLKQFFFFKLTFSPQHCVCLWFLLSRSRLWHWSDLRLSSGTWTFTWNQRLQSSRSYHYFILLINFVVLLIVDIHTI